MLAAHEELQWGIHMEVEGELNTVEHVIEPLKPTYHPFSSLLHRKYFTAINKHTWTFVLVGRPVQTHKNPEQ